MPGSMEQRSALHVEGKDDLHALKHLLYRHGVDCDRDGPEVKASDTEGSGGIDELLAEVEPAVAASTGRSVGFVLDANCPLASRWQAARDRLARVDVDAPDSPPPEGFIAQSDRFQATVGVWLMPDNIHDGRLEDFLESLINENDLLIGHAEAATDRATELEATFLAADRIKAVLHTWLAWQEEPGRPYGSAIRARYFEHDSEVAHRFVAWFKQLYRIDT